MNRPFVLIAVAVLGVVSGCATPHPSGSQAIRKIPPPPMQTETIGTSFKGRPIVQYRFGTGPVSMLIIGGVHGDEPTGISVAEELLKLLQRGEVPPFSGTIAVIPVANPDGYAAKTRRNARQIDVNRNFPAQNWGKSRKGAFHGGSAALSEPETVALHKAVLSLKPRQIISIHSITRGRECNNYDGPGEALAKRLAKYNGYPIKASIGYPTPGSFGSWAGGDLQIPVITLELPRDLPADKAWVGNKDALLEAIRG